MKADRVYRAVFSSYALWLGLLGLPLLPITAVLIKFGWPQFQAKGMVLPAALLIGILIAAYVWLSRYRLIFSASGIAYRSWRKSWSAPYSSIADVSASRVAPISQMPIGAYVHFKDGRRELVYVKVFSLAAIKDLWALATAA